jgi:hypothetical protein
VLCSTLATVVPVQAPARTDFVEHEDDLLLGVALHDVALHVHAAAAQRVARVQHVQDHVRALHHPRELAVEGAP